MEYHHLEITDRFAFWNDKVEKARVDEKIELSLLFEALREYVRTQRNICKRLDKATNTDTQKNYPDVIFWEDGDKVFGMDMHVAIEGSETQGENGETVVTEGQDVKFANLTFTLLDPTNPQLPTANLFADDLVMDGEVIRTDGGVMKDPTSLDNKIRDSMVSVMRGWDRLSFAYTPYVMMMARLTSVGLDHVNAEADPGQLTWKMSAVVGPYLVETELNFGAVVDWFKM